MVADNLARMNANLGRSFFASLLLPLAAGATAETVAAAESPLMPYAGPSEVGVDTSTLTGKVMCGYQGWFSCEGDGADLGWTHWAKDRQALFGPGNISVDLWPDVSEYGDDELFATGFRLADGSPARVFSSSTRVTVLRHFEWMRDRTLGRARTWPVAPMR